MKKGILAFLFLLMFTISSFAEPPEYIIKKINIDSDYTDPKVIRSCTTFDEGKEFTKSGFEKELKRTRERLLRTYYFSEYEVQEQIEGNEVTINCRVRAGYPYYYVLGKYYVGGGKKNLGGKGINVWAGAGTSIQYAGLSSRNSFLGKKSFFTANLVHYYNSQSQTYVQNSGDQDYFKEGLWKARTYFGWRLADIDQSVGLAVQYEKFNFRDINLVYNTTTGLGIDSNKSLFAFGPEYTWDTKNDDIFPTKGFLFNVNTLFYSGDYNFTKSQGEVRAYLPFSKNLVLAGRVKAGVVNGAAPYYSQFDIGGTTVQFFGDAIDGLRAPGYVFYVGPRMFLGTVEGRLRFKPMNMRYFNVYPQVVAFADFGKVYGSQQSIALDNLNTAYGGGLRFYVPNYDMFFRFEYGIGKYDRGFFFRMGAGF